MVYSPLLAVLIAWQAQTTESLSDLLAQLSSSDPKTRIAASKKMIGQSEKLSDDGLEPLLTTLTDPEKEVQDNIRNTLVRAGKSSGKVLDRLVLSIGSCEDVTDLTMKLETLLIQIGRPAVAKLADALRTQNPRVCPWSIHNILQQIGPEARDALPVLNDRLTVLDFYERLRSAETIISIDPRSTSVDKVLKEAFAKEDTRFRAARASAHSTSLRTPEALVVLMEVIADPKSELTSIREAVIAVSCFGPSGKKALSLLARSMDEYEKLGLHEFSVWYAGAIAKIDSSDKVALSLLRTHRKILESNATEPFTRTTSGFCKDLLENVLENKQPKKSR